MLKYILDFLIDFSILLPLFLFGFAKLVYEHLSGGWYLDSSTSTIAQWFNPIQSLISFINAKGKRKSPIQHLFLAFSKLEQKHSYKTETHILEFLEKTEKRGKIKIIDIREEKERFIWEYIFTTRIFSFLHSVIKHYYEKLIGKAATPNEIFYKQFYTITFRKL